jgi:hypothetical protein
MVYRIDGAADNRRELCLRYRLERQVLGTGNVVLGTRDNQLSRVPRLVCSV